MDGYRNFPDFQVNSNGNYVMTLSQFQSANSMAAQQYGLRVQN